MTDSQSYAYTSGKITTSSTHNPIDDMPVIHPQVSALPTASVSYKGHSILVPGNGTSTADTFYICLMSAAGTYSWKSIITG